MSISSGLLAMVITISGLGSDGQRNRELIQAELNKARDFGEQLVVRVPAGNYPIASTLFIYSNTELALDAATVLTRHGSSSHNMLYSRHYNASGILCDSDKTCKHGGYSQFSNIVVSGGKWDAGDGDIDDGGVFHLCHGSGVTIRNASFTRASGHVLNLSGSKDIIVENCTFTDSIGLQKGVLLSGQGPEEDYKMIECIHLDVMNVAGEEGNYPLDDTVCSNVTVSNCTFSNVYSAVGSHRYYPGIALDRLAVTGCSFQDVYGAAVYSVGVKECVMNNCKACNVEELLYASYSEGVIWNNTINDARQDGLFLYDHASYTLKNNTIANSKRNGLNVSASMALIEDNMITNSGAYPLLLGNRSDARVINCALIGSALHGVCALSNSLLSLRGVTIERFQKYGVAVDDAQQVDISACTINGGEGGVYLTSVRSGVIEDNNLSDVSSWGMALGNSCVDVIKNRIVGTQGVGLRIDNCTGMHIEENRFENILATAVYVVAGEVSLTRNIIDRVSQYGVLVTGKSSVSICDNVISSPGSTALYLVGSVNSDIDGNRISNAGAKGIWLQDASEISVAANTIDGALDEGIYCLRSSSVISYNTILGTGKAAVRIEGSAERHASAKVMKNHAKCSEGSVWQDIWFGHSCVDSNAKDNVMGGKGLRIESTVVAEVEVSDICSGSDRALLSYYEITFKSGDRPEIARMLCRRDKVYRLPSSKHKGWQGSTGKIYDNGILFFNLTQTGMTVEMSAIE